MNAFVAAWPPGSEASGITDVLLRSHAEHRRDLVGKLPLSGPTEGCAE